MRSEFPDNSISSIRGIWVVLGACTMAVATLSAVALAMGPLAQGAEPGFISLMANVNLGIAAAGLMAAAAVFMAQGSRLKALADPASRLHVVRVRAIAVTASGEGAAHFSAVMVMLYGQAWWLAPGLAAFALCLGMAAPTAARLRRDIEGKDDKYV